MGLLLVLAPPRDRSFTLLPGADKLGHAALFFGQAWLLERSFRSLRGLPRPGALALAAAVAYGGLLEIYQSFLPARDPDWLDALANAAGAALAIALRPRLGGGRERQP